MTRPTVASAPRTAPQRRQYKEQVKAQHDGYINPKITFWYLTNHTEQIRAGQQISQTSEVAVDLF